MNDQNHKIQFANWLFSGECKFIAGANNELALPKFSLPEVAFLGRSNVGKSSLINALTNRKKLARVSHTPGATKQINFFSIRENLIVIDLPGHGYAKVSKEEMYNWSNLIKAYLISSINLKRVYVLIDSRRGVMYSDQLLFDLLDGIGVVYQIILTKVDKIPKGNIEELIILICKQMKKHQAFFPAIISTSSKSIIGIQDLRIEIAKFSIN